MSGSEIIDPARSPANIRRRIWQFLGPVLGVVLVIATISAISLHNYRSTRNGVISLSSDLLRNLQRYIAQELNNYISPAMESAGIANDMFLDPITDQVPQTFMLYGRSMLAHMPQVDSFYLANDQGQFWLVIRHGDGYDQTHLQKENGQMVYRHVYVDQKGTFKGTGFDPASAPPSSKPWFRGAVERAGKGDEALYWTDPYAYMATHQFIITASIAFRTSDGHQAVFAINISLNRLTDFLNHLQVGRSGQAVIVDMQGHIIAGHNAEALRKSVGFDPSKVKLDPDTQPVFVRALNEFRIKGSGPGIVNSRGRNYVTIATETTSIHRHWVLLINAPESDFSAFEVNDRKQTIIFSVLVVSLACVLALGLILRGRQVDGLKKLLDQTREQIRGEDAAIYEIANTPDLFDSSTDVPILTETLTSATGARRASLWRLLPDGERLLCEDMFDAAKDVHSTGIEILQRDNAQLFDVLKEGYPLVIDDAASDERTMLFQRVVMKLADTNKLVFHPIMHGHQPVGVVILEDPSHINSMDHIIAMVSSVALVRFSHAIEKTSAIENDREDLHQDLQETRYDQGFLVHMPEENNDQFVPSGVYPQVPVMVIIFSDPYIVTQKQAVATGMSIVSALAEKVQDIVRDAGLFSAQVISNRLVLIGECSMEPDPNMVLRLADVAISIREASLTLLANADMAPIFSIGLDIGPVMAAMLGKDPAVFNIWGEAVNTAELLANSVQDAGTIKVSEQFYMKLRDHFLFRSRGNFYLPGTGVTRSFILAGRR
ncbi:cache domain-containing protein [Swingsia samuiensis]|uniref:GAF domain-containing protein n=1 Tax=Swingsia samuiensis TaxID=1293412 RepID=A0A4Y6UJ99_9PROT|nr:cache domain-containing protein [Swingsia samuiensis]QDH17689.1 GAF domain-containing protein [Swingsia samuiensis]